MKKIILAIDDNEETLELEEIILTNAGYHVHTAKSGKEALAKLNELSNVNLILLDYEMDHMNGPEFLIEFEKSYPKHFYKTPVVFVTAHENPPQTLGRTCIPKLKDLDVFIKDVGNVIQ